MHYAQDILIFWKSTVFRLLMLGCLFTPSFVISSSEPEPGKNESADAFVLPDLQGRVHRLADYNGKVVLINFWASWCVPCINEMPELTQLKKQLANQPFEILALNVGENKNRVKQFVKQMHFKLPVLLDTTREAFNNWGVKVLPSSFLVDAKGRIRQRIPGNPGWDNDQVIFLIEKLIEEAVQPVVSK